ncbi:MAG: Rhs family protein [Cupriavidus sp.]|nr:Rhs family protein [Cupriavidus sp.]
MDYYFWGPDYTFKFSDQYVASAGYPCYPYYKGQWIQNDNLRNSHIFFTGISEFCIDPITRTYSPSYWRRNPTVPLHDQCPDLPKATNNSCPIGNPVNPLTGQKTQSEPPDFKSAGPNSIVLQRTYRSEAGQYFALGGLASSWVHNWQRFLSLGLVSDSSPTIVARRADGASVVFISSGGKWVVADGSSHDYIVAGANSNGVGAWQYYSVSDDSVEAYDAAGRLLTITERNGWVTTLAYTNDASSIQPAGGMGLLTSVTNRFGTSIQFKYDSTNRLSSVLLPDGKSIQYDRPADGSVTVTWPDQASRRYLYEDKSSPQRMTGITDELGVRYATYKHQAGYVVSEEHAGGTDKLSFSYGTNSTLVTDGNGLTRTFNYQLAGKLRQPTGASGSSPIGDPFNTIQYDASNNVSRTVDRNGNDTRYSYDALGRETQRVDGYGTADAKTTTTEWHPTWNLPLKVAAPGRVDYFTYDSQGQMTAHGWFPTADANGSQGLNAAPSGAVSSNSYGYDAHGLMTSLAEVEDGAIAKQWSFTYDAQGNLLTATDGSRTARGLAYDPAGRLLEAVNIDGDTLKYVYDSRGRVTQYVFGENLTAYVYDAIGQKVLVTSPQGDVTNYVYDAAHRLIDVLYNGESLTTPQAPETAAMTMAEAESGADNAGANPFAAWFGWLAKLFKWLLPSAHAQGAPAPSPPIYGGGGSAPGTYTPNPLQELVPGLSGEKTPSQWLAMATQRAIDYCGSKVKENIHRGKIQAQGAGYRDPGVGDVETWGPQLSPPTVEWGLGALERIEARMSDKQRSTRNEALKKARRYVIATAASGGLDAVEKQSFYNRAVEKDMQDGISRTERVDVDILSGKAFVP